MVSGALSGLDLDPGHVVQTVEQAREQGLRRRQTLHRQIAAGDRHDRESDTADRRGGQDEEILWATSVPLLPHAAALSNRRR